MAGLAQQTLNLQRKTDEPLQAFEQIRPSKTINQHSVASFATTVMEAIRQLFKQS